MKTLAIIPARAGSKRILGKNIKPFLGRPLIHWTMEFALAEAVFSKVVVSTDCPKILSIAEEMGVNHNGLRPSELASDTASSVDVALHELDRAELSSHFDFVALLQPTTPFRRNAAWQESYNYLLEGSAASVVGVSQTSMVPEHIFRRDAAGNMTPLLPEGLKMRTQELAPAFQVNGSLFHIRADSLREERSFYASPLKSVLCDSPVEDIDIDTPEDWANAEQSLRAAGLG